MPVRDQGGGPAWLGRLLCWLGVHDFRLVECTMGFGTGGRIETVECRRCGHRATRRGRDQE